VNLNVPVALKEMTSDPSADQRTLAQLRAQFQREAQVVAGLDHPHLVRVTDYFSWGGSECLVMNFVEGESLADCIQREGAQPEAQVLEWAQQLLGALGYCHARGVIHRDVKPQNVIITPDGSALPLIGGAGGGAVLVDFGLVKLWDPQNPRTQTVIRAMGTPEYAPPEQYSAMAGHTDPRSDLYSLGATLYHALTGQTPMSATDRMARPEQFASPRTLAPRVSPQTEAVVLKVLELPITQRFSTAQEMINALRGASPVSPPIIPTPTKPTARPPVWVWVLGGAVLLVLLIGCMIGIGVVLPAIRGDVPTGVPDTPTSTPVLPTAVPTRMPTAIPTPTSTPPPIVTEPEVAYYPVSLGSISNALLTENFISPPTGDVTLGGVPFQLSEWVFKSQASSSPDNSYPTRISLPVNVLQASKLHLLLVAGNGFNRFDEMVIGEVVVCCAGTSMSVTDLQLGRDICEWHVTDNVVSTASRVRQVWSGAITDSPHLTGHIDMLSLNLPIACLSSGLTAIEIVDSSTSTVNSPDPALNIIGITVERHP